MNIKYLKNIFVVVIIILITAGVYIIYIKENENRSGVQAKNKGTYTTKEFAIGITEFDTINPILTKSLEIQHITKLVYEPLIDITEDFDIKPAIAEEWSKLDKLTYIVKLDENKMWQNGEPLKVEDIEFTINEIKNTNSIYQENVEVIESIEKINETTLKIHLKEETEFFEYLLCFPIVQEKTYNSSVPIGTGKFKIQNVDENQIILQGEETKLIITVYNSIAELYNGFTRENVDLIITQNTEYEEYIGNIGFEETIIIGREFYYISCENIENKELRQYINNSISKEKLVYDLYKNKYHVADFPLDYGSYLHKENNIKQETESVKYKSITLSTEKENYEIAEEIKKQLEEKNININIQTYRNSKADLLLKKKTVPITPEIDGYFEDEKIKSQIDQIGKIENKEILSQEYEKITDNYYEEVPFISLFFNSYIVLHNNKLKGNFSGNWFKIFYNMDTWYKVI